MKIQTLTNALDNVLGNRDKFFMGYCNNGNDFSLVERSSLELAEEIVAHLPIDKHLSIIEKLIKEFDNPDNHSHQRSAIEDAKEYLEIHKGR